MAVDRRSPVKIILALVVAATFPLLAASAPDAVGPDAPRASSAVAPIQATLALIPSTTLPGVPVSFELTLLNGGATTVSFDRSYGVHVARGDEEFDVNFSYGASAHPTVVSSIPRQPRETDESSLIEVAAGGQKRLFITVNFMLTGNQTFADPRLSFPGSYRIRILLPTLGISTNETTLTIEQPTGEDLAVWNEMLRLTDGEGWYASRWLTEPLPIKRDHPSSRYAAFLALPSGGVDALSRIQDLSAGVASVPNGSWRDELRLALADQHGVSAGEYFSNNDLAGAALHSQEQARILRDLVDRPGSSWAPTFATAAMPYYVTRADWDARVKFMQHPTTIGAVRPRVTCSKEIGGELLITFGYQNPNSFSVTIPIGERNSFAPSPADRDQPSVFLPGAHDAAFSVRIQSKEDSDRALVWKLDGRALATNSTNDPRCANN
jgi:hypothetical protein